MPNHSQITGTPSTITNWPSKASKTSGAKKWLPLLQLRTLGAVDTPWSKSQLPTRLTHSTSFRMITSSTVKITSPQLPGQNLHQLNWTLMLRKSPSPSLTLDSGASPLLRLTLPGQSMKTQRDGTLWKSRVTTTSLPTTSFAKAQCSQLRSMTINQNSCYLSPNGPQTFMIRLLKLTRLRLDSSTQISRSPLILWMEPQNLCQLNQLFTFLCAMSLASTGQTPV